MTLNTPGGMPGLLGGLGDHERVERRPRVRLQHDRAPGGQRGRAFTTLSMNGKLNGVIAATTPIGSRTSALPPTPVGPPAGGPSPTTRPSAGHVGVGAEHADRAAGLDEVGDEAGRARLGDHQLAQLGAAALEDLRHPHQRGGALRRLLHGHGPSSKALRAASIARDRVLRGRLGDAADRLFGGRVDDLDPPAALARPGAVDVEVVVPGCRHRDPPRVASPTRTTGHRSLGEATDVAPTTHTGETGTSRACYPVNRGRPDVASAGPDRGGVSVPGDGPPGEPGGPPTGQVSVAGS